MGGKMSGAGEERALYRITQKVITSLGKAFRSKLMKNRMSLTSSVYGRTGSCVIVEFPSTLGAERAGKGGWALNYLGHSKYNYMNDYESNAFSYPIHPFFGYKIF